MLHKLLLIFMVIALTACGGSIGGGDKDVDTADEIETDTGEEVTDVADVTQEELPPGERPVDILLVIDNSRTMLEEQERFKVAISAFLNALLDPPAGVNPKDVHIGVITSDMGDGFPESDACSALGDDAKLQNDTDSDEAGCTGSFPVFLEYEVEDAPDASKINAITDMLSCLVLQGQDGCGFEHQLEATLLALTNRASAGGPNEDFPREDAVLAIVYLSNENDCSSTTRDLFDPDADDELGPLPQRCFNNPELFYDMERYTTGLRSLTSNPRNLLVVSIVGVMVNSVFCEGEGDGLGGCLLQPEMEERLQSGTNYLYSVCAGPGSPPPIEATPGRRFVELAQDLEKQAYVWSICQETYAAPMQWLAAQIKSRL